MALDIAVGRKSHDLVFENGDLILIDGAERVYQQIKITLLTFLGEWFLDTTFGIPYFEQIFGKVGRSSTIENIFRAKISEVPDVTSIPSLTVSLDNATRICTVQFNAMTEFGLINRSVVLSG